MPLRLLCIAFWCSAIAACANHPTQDANKNANAPDTPLYGEILAMDQRFFAAFNRQDLGALGEFFSRDLEFYHDKGGFSDYAANMAASKRLFENYKTLRRELVAGSMEVYPVKDYGAIQLGSHRFCNWEQGKADCGVFRFAHIWKREGDGWKLSRVISYDH